jgi:hypothetical protein
MGSIGELSFGRLELIGWAMQILLIAVVVLRSDGRIRFQTPSVSLCALVIALGWAFRLAYLFALASGGLTYWIGDEPLRWLTTWEWMQGSQIGAGIPRNWMPGTYYVHGFSMWLTSDPLYGSKLVSATYALMSLVGVFVFAQSVFRDRVLSIACVIFQTPFWIDILLSVGTMTEMPTVGTMLGGGGALIAALRAPVGRRRMGLFVCAAVSFAIGTLFHFSAWILLAGILLFVLPIFLREKHGSLITRFRSWIVFCAISTPYCLLWAVDTWARTGNPFTPLLAAAEHGAWKIGGPTHVFEIVGENATPAAIALVALAIVSVAVCIGLHRVRIAGNGSAFSHVTPARLSWASWLSTGVALILCAFAWEVVSEWQREISPGGFENFIANWGVYPVSIVYCAFYYLPLALYGVGAIFFDRDERRPQPRAVLGCIGFLLAILVATAVNGGANISPFRTILPLSTALLPFALAPLFDLRPTEGRVEGKRGTAWLSVAIALGVFGHGFAANHDRIFSEVPWPSIFIGDERQGAKPKGADIYALGAWIRAEMGLPGYLSSENLSHPFELALAVELLGIRQNLIEYSVGDPARFARPRRSMKKRPPEFEKAILDGLVTDQVLISDHAIDDSRLRLIARLNVFSIYERVTH